MENTGLYVIVLQTWVCHFSLCISFLLFVKSGMRWEINVNVLWKLYTIYSLTWKLWGILLYFISIQFCQWWYFSTLLYFVPCYKVKWNCFIFSHRRDGHFQSYIYMFKLLQGWAQIPLLTVCKQQIGKLILNGNLNSFPCRHLNLKDYATKNQLIFTSQMLLMVQ